MTEITCPYCGHRQFIDVDVKMCGGSARNEGFCYKCSQSYFFRVYVIYCCESEEAPCLNRKSHKYENIWGYPEEFFEGKLRCKWCGEEKVDEAVNQATIERYYDRLKKKYGEG